MNECRKEIVGLRRRLTWLLVWDAFFRAAVGWVFICGAAVLALRLLGRPLNGLMIFSLGGLAVISGITSFFALRRRPSSDAVAALMDARLGGGGLVMAAAAEQSADWSPVLKPLKPRWRGGMTWLVLAAALSFLVLAARVPLYSGNTRAARSLEIEALVAALEEQVELLEEIGLIEEEQATEWSTLMAALEQESCGDDPAATWEALDELSNRMADSVAVEVAERRAELQQREEMASALKAALQAYNGDRAAADAAMKELSDLLSKAAADNPELQKMLESLPEFGMSQLAAGCLSKEQAAELAKRLSEMTAEELERMKQLAEQGLCEAGSCSEPGDAESLQKFLSANPGCTNLMACAGMPGTGGIDRGPGAAPISWLGESSEEGVDFKEQLLTASKRRSLAESKLVGESFGAPEADARAAGSTGGVLKGAQAGDSAATVHAVLPRHRGAVDRFFMRKDGEK